MKINFKHIIFILLIILLALPLIQHAFKWIPVRPLTGDFVLVQRPEYSWAKWMDGSFQNQFDRYIEDHIGFRPFFVRLNNQLDFTLFRKANAEGVVVGKNNMLYEYDYIRAYTGNDFIGKATLDKKLNRFLFLQHYLKTRSDIDMILALEPGKARTYPENIPDSYLKKGKSLSNYEYISQKADELGINLLDLNRIFVNARDTATYPLYPLYGIHWSEHTMPFVADTLISFMENIRKIDMPDFFIKKIIINDSLADSDYDVGNTINLLFDLPHQSMPYPVFGFNTDTSKTKPMVLAVADSYYWNFFNTRVPAHLFANEAFWYFNAKVYPDFYFQEKWTSDLDLKTEVEKQDIILISVTERFLYKFDWNFIDQLYELYTPEYTGDIVYNYENQIRLDAGWFDSIVLKIENQGISLEEAIRKEAYYQSWVQEPEIFLTWYGRDHFKNVISNDVNWVNDIRKKAENQKVTFEDQLEKDADYVFEKEYPEIYKLNRLIEKFRESIYADSAWLRQVIEKADNYLMPADEMVKVDAEYLARQELFKSPLREDRIRYYEQRIMDDPEWLESVKVKASEQGKTLEEMIREDAVFMTDQEEETK
ncbi:MAG: hypothetical protein EOM06_01545 [Sphingobacteriia bacterium]|nr:hypothetical protein [Sphingobacteriia bacterium]